MAVFDLQASSSESTAKGCLDLRAAGCETNGIYVVSDNSNRVYHVYCDFTSEPNFVYTLVTSWKFSNRMFKPFRTKSYRNNHPVNESNPNWDSYRLSYQRMEALRNLKEITHWRITCNFDVNGVNYRDYLRAAFSRLDILAFEGGSCRTVEYINVMGSGCQDCQIFFRQASDLILSVESEQSSKICGMTFVDGRNVAIRNIKYLFGSYCIGCYNSMFQCSRSESSTTSLWFGGVFEPKSDASRI